MGYETINFNHFFDIEEFEEIMFGIIKEGVIVNFFLFFSILDSYYKQRIYKTIFEDCINGKILPEYDKRKNVPQVAVDFKNLVRRVKDNPTKIRAKDENEIFKMKIINNFNEIPKSEYDVYKEFDDTINLRPNNAELMRQLLEILTPYIEMHGDAKIKVLFKPYFYLLFENDKRSGLLKENDFFEDYKTKYDDVVSYNGNFKTYYNSRIKALVGF